MRLKLLVVVALVVGVAGTRDLRCQAITVDSRLTLEKDTVRIGDPFRVFVSVRVPKGATIDFPVALDSSGTVQSIDPRAVYAQSDSVGFRQNAVYRVAAWDVGRQP